VKREAARRAQNQRDDESQSDVPYLVSQTHSNLDGCCFLNTYTWLFDILSCAIITWEQLECGVRCGMRWRWRQVDTVLSSSVLSYPLLSSSVLSSPFISSPLLFRLNIIYSMIFWLAISEVLPQTSLISYSPLSYCVLFSSLVFSNLFFSHTPHEGHM
jgi:hypothetical protein